MQESKEDEGLDPKLDTSRPGREEEVIPNTDTKTEESEKTILTKDDDIDQTAEKTFREGLQNNSDTSTPL